MTKDTGDAEAVEIDDTDHTEAVEITDPIDDADDEVDAALVPAPGPPGLARRVALPVALAVLLLASIGLTAWSYFALYGPDRATDETVSATVVQAASDGTVALLSYSPDTLDGDFAKAKSRLTGDFLNYYTQFTADIVTPAAKQKSVKTTAQVVRSALAQLSGSSAEVLLFINQSTTSKENPDGAFTASSVKVGLTKVGNDWLISSFDPV
jgi:Mce-associated membrane protein